MRISPLRRPKDENASFLKLNQNAETCPSQKAGKKCPWNWIMFAPSQLRHWGWMWEPPGLNIQREAEMRGFKAETWRELSRDNVTVSPRLVHVILVNQYRLTLHQVEWVQRWNGFIFGNDHHKTLPCTPVTTWPTDCKTFCFRHQRATLETCDTFHQSDEETWPDKKKTMTWPRSLDTGPVKNSEFPLRPLSYNVNVLAHNQVMWDIS